MSSCVGDCSRHIAWSRPEVREFGTWTIIRSFPSSGAPLSSSVRQHSLLWMKTFHLKHIIVVVVQSISGWSRSIFRKQTCAPRSPRNTCSSTPSSTSTVYVLLKKFSSFLHNCHGFFCDLGKDRTVSWALQLFVERERSEAVVEGSHWSHKNVQSRGSCSWWSWLNKQMFDTSA